MKACASWSKLDILYKGKERTVSHNNLSLLITIITVGQLSVTLNSQYSGTFMFH